MTTNQTTFADRFSELLREPLGNAEEIYNRPLLSRNDWVAAPTLGSIVPNWIIAVPRKAALNFRAWHHEYRREPEAIIAELRDHLNLASDEIIWFEHGPAAKGTAVGCGQDYAHLHIIIKPEFEFDVFLKCARNMSQLSWDSVDAAGIYSRLPSHVSYLVAGSGKRAAVALNVESTGSQFFRKVVGSLSGRAECWDYKRYDHSDNIAQTVRTFRRLEKVVGRGT